MEIWVKIFGRKPVRELLEIFDCEYWYDLSGELSIPYIDRKDRMYSHGVDEYSDRLTDDE